jgi:hypothetical protein
MANFSKDPKPKKCAVIDVRGRSAVEMLAATRIGPGIMDPWNPQDTLFLGPPPVVIDYGAGGLEDKPAGLVAHEELRKSLRLTQPVLDEHCMLGVKKIWFAGDKDCSWPKDYEGNDLPFTLANEKFARMLARWLGEPECRIRNVVVEGRADFLEDLVGQCDKAGLRAKFYVVDQEETPEGLFPRGAGEGSWRDGFKSFGQMSAEQPKFLLGQLVPEKALTMIPAASYNCKTWFAMGASWAISQGQDYLGFKGPDEPVAVSYYVPEMNESLVRSYLATIGVRDTEDFLVRPMESGLWALSDPRMLESARDRLVVLDTTGYFNEADDTSSYQQSLRFATQVYDVLVKGGARAVVGLYHPPKYSREETAWTLENSILGSAGYGGILRSCLRMANLNPDLNDPDVWVYVQGLKNPGLKPFQLCGPMPLKMKVPPGKSPYLSSLLSGDSKYGDAEKMFKDGVPQRKVAEQLGLSLGKVNKMAQEWKKDSKDKQVSPQADLVPEPPEEP